MLAIIDGRAPKVAIENLRKHVDEVFQFESGGITFNSISGHPDVFIYQDETNLVVAPNAPLPLLKFFDAQKIHFVFGELKVEENFENSVGYNCLSTEHYFFHKAGYTDPVIIKLNQGKEFIDLPQAYTRCSLTYLGNNKFITSDKGIGKKLSEKGLDYFYFDPGQISIVDHKHGFLGGTNGLHGDKIFFIGNSDRHSDGFELRNYIEDSGIEMVSLFSNFLYDGGGILFIEGTNFL